MRVTLLDTVTTLFCGVFGVAVPFLLGRWTRGTCRCGGSVSVDIVADAQRARAAGIKAAHRLRERAVSPDHVREQAARDRRDRMHLLERTADQ